MSCGVGHRLGLDPVLLWLWHRPMTTALIQSVAWEFPYAAGMALKSKQTKKKKNEKVLICVFLYFSPLIKYSNNIYCKKLREYR